jgi:hypothetical protein
MKDATKLDVSGSHDHRRSRRLPRVKAVAYQPVNKIAASQGDKKGAQENNQYSVVHSRTCLSRLLAVSASAFRD